MLQIKQKFHLTLPRLTGWTRHHVALTPEEPENDELIEAIATDVAAHDDSWRLTEQPNAQEVRELTSYWDKVEDDIRHDPEWKTISESDA